MSRPSERKINRAHEDLQNLVRRKRLKAPHNIFRNMCIQHIMLYSDFGVEVAEEFLGEIYDILKKHNMVVDFTMLDLRRSKRNVRCADPNQEEADEKCFLGSDILRCLMIAPRETY